MVALDGFKEISGLVPVDVWALTIEFSSEEAAQEFAQFNGVGASGFNLSITKLTRWVSPYLAERE